MFETSVVLGEKQLKGDLMVFDIRHKVFVEKITGPVIHENGFWIWRTVAKSDSVTTSREHRISKANFVYERTSLVQMGNTPPLATLNRGRCERV